MSGVSVHGVIEMPCLGRPFQLGTLYDCRNDSVIPGVTLWGPDTLGTAISKPIQTSDFEVITEDSLSEKMLRLDVSAELKLSVLCGLVKAGGSSMFLYDRTTSKSQARVSLRYKSTSRYEQLDMSQLGKVEYPRVFEDDIATHVVTGVQYGADAIFVFDQKVDNSEKTRQILDKMEAMIDALPSMIGDSENEKKELEKIQCKFYGDFLLTKNPTTYQDVIKVYQELLKPKTDVPKKVWLCPLSKLDSRVQRMVCEISPYLIDDLQKVMESWHELEIRINDLVRNEVCIYFEDIKCDLEKLNRLFGGYKVTNLKYLSTLLPKVRGGGEEEAKLAELLVVNDSPFSYEQVSSWIKDKEAEVAMLAVYLKELKKNEIQFAFQSDEMVTHTSGFEIDSVLCFDFNISAENDPQLKKMEDYTHYSKKDQSNTKVSPHISQYKSQELRQQLRRFLNFVKANSNKSDSNYKYVVTNGHGGVTATSTTSKLGIISVFVDACPTEFDPPDQPGMPRASIKTHNTLHLSWSKPKYGSDSVQSYTVSYRSVNDPPDKWSTQTSSEEYLVLTKLTPGSMYHIKVTAETNAGSSPESKIGEEILPPNQPGKPVTIKKANNSLQLKWSKPEHGASIVDSYTVHFRSEDDPPDQWNAETCNEECLVLTKLTPGSLYQFKVTAESTVGSSPESNIGEERMPLDQPGKPVTIKKACNSLQLKWSKPEHGASTFSSFTVHYRSVDDPPDQWSTQTSSEECLVLTKLTPGSLYHFKVTAESTVGSSPESEVGEERLPPDQPGKPETTKKTHNSLQLKWSKPELGATIVSSYVIHYRSEDDQPDQWSTQTSSEECLVLTKLTPGSLYHFKVTAESAVGSSPHSDVSEDKLPPDQSGKPYATRKTHNSIEVQWAKPKYGASIVQSYSVFYRSNQSDQWISHSTNSALESALLVGLVPITTYLVKIQAVSCAGVSPESDVSDPIETTLSPPSKPLASEVTHNRLLLDWKEPEYGADCILSYTVFFCSVARLEGKSWCKISSVSNFTTITNLTPNTLYHFKVRGETARGSSLESEVNDSIQTMLPPPDKLTFSKVTHNTVLVSWKAPEEIVKFVLSYTVLYRSAMNSSWQPCQTNATEMNVTDLLPGSLYYFKVRVESAAGLSPARDEHEVLLLPDRPGKPYAIATEITPTTIQVQWSKPNHGAESVRKYNLSYQSVDDKSNDWIPQVTADAKDSSLLVTELTPSVLYHFKVVAISDAGVSSESELSDPIETLLPPPGKPYATDVTYNSVTLMWSKPEHSEDKVICYTVSCCSDNSQRKTTCAEEKFIWADLIPKSTYKFTVRAETSSTPSPESDVSDLIETKLPPLEKPWVSDISCNSVCVHWKGSKQDYAQCVQSYTILYCTKIDLSSNKWKSQATNGVVESLILNNLMPGNLYYFKVRAETATGSGVESDVVSALLPPAQPGKPYVANITPNCIRLQWTKPSLGAEYIQQYIVWYQSVNGQWNSKSTNDVLESAILTDLVPNTIYCAMVQAVSSAGKGSNSEHSDPIETLLPPPGKPYATSTTHNSVTLNWEKPNQGANKVLFYTISYCSSKNTSGKWLTQKTATAEPRLNVVNLVPKTVYNFKVKAETSTNSSPLSEISSPTETNIPPPGKPRAYKVTHNSLLLCWKKPDGCAEHVQSYTVQYCTANNQHSWITVPMHNVSEIDHNCHVQSLFPNTTYVFKVKGETVTGPSCDSELSDHIMTLLSPPGKPYCTEAINYESIQITWKKPSYAQEYIQYYSILYQAEGEPQHKWSNLKTSNDDNIFEFIVPNTEKVYVFKVSAVTTSGKYSTESEVSEPIATKQKPWGVRLVNSCKPISKNPDVYQLPLTRTTTKVDIVKVDVGKSAPPRSRWSLPVKNKVLMVVGATGAGKSTLIDGIANYIMGVDWEDEFRFKLISEETAHDQTKSQTKCITAYTFHKDRGSPLPYTLTLIDTPGFGDTGGLKRDKQIVAQIKEFFTMQGDEGIDQLHGIGFVASASQPRLTPTQRYVFDSILSVFGKDVADNIFLMVTFADGKQPPVLEAARTAGVPFQHFFKFNNSALFASNQANDEFDKMFWKMGRKSFQDFFHHFLKAKTRSLQQSREVLKERECLETAMKGLQPQIQAGLATIDELKQESGILKEHEADIITSKDFVYTVTVTKQRKIDMPVGHYVTNCLNCNFTCHGDCIYSDDKDKFKCSAMNNQGEQDATCRVCPNKCSWEVHVNNPYMFEIYQEEEERTLDDLKARYDSAMTNKSQVECVMERMKKELEKLNYAVLGLINQARRSLQRLKEIALKPDHLTQVDYIDLMIESEKQEAKPGWKERVATLQEVRKQAEILTTVAEQKGAGNPFFYDSDFLQPNVMQEFEDSESGSTTVWASVWDKISQRLPSQVKSLGKKLKASFN